MAAYLIVDVDNLIEGFTHRGISVDFQELAVGLRGGAALAAGLISADKLKAVAVSDWTNLTSAANLQRVFKTAGYEVFDMPLRDSLADALILHYFSFDPEPVDELILATSSPDLIPLIQRVKTTRNARIRVWGSENILTGTQFQNEVIFQPLESLLGIQTKNVAIYIDFENIAISLNEQGFIVNLDHLIDRFLTQGKAHGQVVKLAAYAPWGQRGSLPPLVDSAGREVAEEAPSRLLMANIDPVFNLPGKNSADMRIAKDVITDSGHDDSADVYIMASGDRDFNEVLNTLRQRNKTVIVWGVRGSTSRQLENNPGISIEYIDDFTDLQTHQSLSAAPVAFNGVDNTGFTPSQWSSVILQFDRLATALNTKVIPLRQVITQLQEVGAVISRARGEDLVSQATSLGILKPISTSGDVTLNDPHPIVEKTRLIRDRIVVRVYNTLTVRGWEYVNYGFLLKGLAMDRDLDKPGCNYSDQWRSEWIDCLVREHILMRELIPHRHNPDDLVPVIKLRPDLEVPAMDANDTVTDLEDAVDIEWTAIPFSDMVQRHPETASMVQRIIVSVEQFTSFRNFSWCPLGSLHRRLRPYDTGMAFQRGVEYLVQNNAALVQEYDNPQSDFQTKGISLDQNTALCSQVLDQRDRFIAVLLEIYERNTLISEQTVQEADPESNWDMGLWFSIMETENVLNLVPGRTGQYSLFRTHHTVNLVAEALHT
ncbi:MAG: NYN domain-containing protein [Anaerolineaceae bacterium]|nr:NYN domain-containing protein [Anaerolineaceae bacterium]